MIHDCWCCGAQRMAALVGRIVGRRAADILLVSDCRVKDCSVRASSGCLIRREIEGRW
jgi:hypothetical protein